MINAVIFDLGETILSFGRFSAVRIFRKGARLSYDFLKSCGQSVGNFEIYCWRNLIALHLRNLISSITGNDFNSTAFLRGNGRKIGFTLNGEQWRHFAWLWYEPLSKIAKIESDIKETLSSLNNSGIKLGILSNTFVSGHSLEKHLEQLGILEFFTVRLYSYKFSFRKPNKQIFQIAAERIGEPCKNIMYVGDRIDKDARPALKLGMTSVIRTAYTNIGKKVPDKVFKIKKLSELPALVERINSRRIATPENA